MEEFTDVIYERNLKRNSITSYGLILYTIKEGQILYLVAQQRDSITIKEIFHQILKDVDLLKYASNLSHEEMKRLQTESFHDLLDDVYIGCNPREYQTLSNNEQVFKANVELLKKYMNKESIGVVENSWIFPRGRKRFNESDIGCILREVNEETGLNRKHITIYDDIEPYEEYYMGLNKRMYHIVYYIGYIHHSKTKVNYNIKTKYRSTISNEISDVKWLPYEQAYEHLDLSKRYILKLANTVLTLNLKRNHIKRRHSF